jgi:hypothetical protein
LNGANLVGGRITNEVGTEGSVGASNVLVNNGRIIFTNVPSTTPAGILTTNTPTNSFLNGTLGPIYIPSSSETMILTNEWAYIPSDGTNQQVFVTLTSPLVTFTAGSLFSASQAPVTIVITNVGGGSSGGTILVGNTFPGALEGIGSSLGLVTGTTGYSLYYTNNATVEGRFASFVAIVCQ